MNYLKALEEATNPEGGWNIPAGKTSTQSAIHVRGDTLYASFDKSGDKRDWLFNLMFWTTAYRDMAKRFYVHKGFRECFRELEPELNQALSPEVKHVVLRGHSKGGAMVMLSHEWFQFHYPSLELDSIAFACPRVFSVFGYRLLSQRLSSVIRVYHRFDLVPKIPPIFPFLYSHYGKRVRLGKFFDRENWKQFFKSIGSFHQPSSYKKALQEI